MKFLKFSTIFLLAFSGCSHFVIDPSPTAIASGDLTLALKACDGPLASGFGVCRVKEGAQIQSSWQIVIPIDASLGGEIVVKARDISKSYAVTSSVVNIPLSDFFGSGVWDKKDSSILTATASIRVKYPDGLEKVVQAQGDVLLRVLAKDYDPLPLNSGLNSWGTKCEVQYSDAGRSAVECKE